jgi:DedD protein
MRDAHRMKERFDLSLDNRQVVSLLIGGLIVLGAVFVLGVVVGKKLAGSAETRQADDILSALDRKAERPAPAAAEVPLTFQDELTKKHPDTPSAPARATEPKPVASRAEIDAPSLSAPSAHFSGSSPGGNGGGAAALRDLPGVADKGPTDPSRDLTIDPENGAATAPRDLTVGAEKRDAAAARDVTGRTEKEKGTATAPRDLTLGAEKRNAVAARDLPAGAGKVKQAAVATRAAQREGVKDAVVRSTPARPPQGAVTGGAFTLQLSSTQNREEADRFVAKLRDRGYAPYVLKAEVPGRGTWYRIRMGSFPTKEAAQRYLADFKRETQLQAFVATSK